MPQQNRTEQSRGGVDVVFDVWVGQRGKEGKRGEWGVSSCKGFVHAAGVVEAV